VPPADRHVRSHRGSEREGGDTANTESRKCAKSGPRSTGCKMTTRCHCHRARQKRILLRSSLRGFGPEPGASIRVFIMRGLAPGNYDLRSMTGRWALSCGAAWGGSTWPCWIPQWWRSPDCWLWTRNAERHQAMRLKCRGRRDLRSWKPSEAGSSPWLERLSANAGCAAVPHRYRWCRLRGDGNESESRFSLPPTLPSAKLKAPRP